MKDNYLAIIKTLFFALIVLFVIVITAGLYYADEGTHLNVWNSLNSIETDINHLFNAEESLLNYTQGASCEFRERGRTIILRLDDVAAWRYKEISRQIVYEALDRKMGITLGVIPYNLGRDPHVTKWLKEIRTNPLLEIALHGFNHEENEFMNLTKEEALDKIVMGKNEIVESIGVVPVTFIPPYNEYSKELREALLEQGLRIFSAKENEYVIDEEFISVGYNARTYDFYTKRFIPVEEIISDCKASLDKTETCVVMIHPQDYLLEPPRENIDEEKYQEFLRTLDELEKLEAEFKTFKDLLECSYSLRN